VGATTCCRASKSAGLIQCFSFFSGTFSRPSGRPPRAAPSSAAYALSTVWYHSFSQASQSGDDAFSLPIDNGDLFAGGSRATFPRDYVLLSEGSWHMLHGWFGGGPAAPVSVQLNTSG
jgi:hypothetical protein